jgi:hypothetical protein
MCALFLIDLRDRPSTGHGDKLIACFARNPLHSLVRTRKIRVGKSPFKRTDFPKIITHRRAYTLQSSQSSLRKIGMKRIYRSCIRVQCWCIFLRHQQQHIVTVTLDAGKLCLLCCWCLRSVEATSPAFECNVNKPLVRPLFNMLL